MLTSKEVLEKTGISRATLNNYISWGIVPRPEVLPPAPDDGAAPRIGYFQPGVIARIEEIQRLKREGWSISRITERFGTPGAAAGTGSAPPPGRDEPRGAALPALSLGEIDQPAYLVNDRFEVVWFNAAASSPAWPNLAALPAGAVSRGLFQYLARSRRGEGPDGRPGHTVLRLHVGLARQRGASLEDVCRDVAAADVPLLESLYRDAEPFDFPMVVRVPVADERGGADGAFLYALNFQEGVLFIYLPGAGSLEILPAIAPPVGAASQTPSGSPALVPVAVVVAELQDSMRLWSELPAEEYFELITQVWAALEPIFQRHHGLAGKHAGDGMAWYFEPRGDSGHLWDALLAAQQARDAMRRLSRQWQTRKGWTTELCMNAGVDEGHEWRGILRPEGQEEFAMLGDAFARASRLAAIGRCGAIWASRNLVGKLPTQERGRLKYGVTRKGRHGQEVFVPSTYSRMEDLPEPMARPADTADAFARLSVTEILDIAADAGDVRTYPHQK